MEVLKIGIIAENTVEKKDLLGEFGLALWVEYNGRRFLFDTGQGLVLSHNLKKMRLHPNTLQGIILSHGHFDHCGGLMAIIEEYPHLQVYAHPGIFHEKVMRKRDRYIHTGVSFTEDDLTSVSLTLHTGPYELTKDMILTGSIPRREKVEERDFFIKDASGYRRDLVEDDQALIIKTAKGLVVVLGCTHAGLINTLDYVLELMGEDAIYGVIGGMHLHNKKEEELEKILESLSTYSIERLVPLHCSGSLASSMMRKEYPHSFKEASCGVVFKDF